MFREEGLYGWGVCPIRMPRAAQDIYSDRRKRTVKIPFPDRRKAASHPWRPSVISRIIVDDLPWSQAAFLSLLSFMILISMYLINGWLPIRQNEQLSEPIDIVVSLLEEKQEKSIPSVQEKILQSTEYEQRDTQVVTTPIAEKPQKNLKPEKQFTYTAKQSQVPQETWPEVRVKPGIKHNPARSSRAIAPVTIALKKRPRPDVIAASPVRPFDYSRKKLHKNSSRWESDVVRDFVIPRNDRPGLQNIHADRPQRRYASALTNHEGPGYTQDVSTADVVAFNPRAGTSGVALPKTRHPDERYASREISPPYPLQAGEQSPNQKVSFQSQRKGHSIPETAKQPRSLSRQSLSSQRTPQGPAQLDSVPTFGQQISVSEVNLPQRSLVDDPYVPEPKASSEVPGPQTEEQRVSFKNQKQKDTLMPAPSSRRPASSRDPRLFQDGSGFLAKFPDFSANGLTEEIDPSQLISLKEFKVCIDPEEEFRLKTQLAVQLDGPSWFKSNGVVFFCNYTESGYTLQVDVYNPQGRPFKSRCEVLGIALEAVGIKE